MPFCLFPYLFFLLPGHPRERGFMLVSLVSVRLSAFLSYFRTFLVFSFSFCICVVIRTRFADSLFTFLDQFAIILASLFQFVTTIEVRP